MKKVQDMNYYELLNIEPIAKNEEIQKAYYLACQTYQPESLATYSVLSEAERAKMMKQIEKAYQTLMDEVERERYNHKIGISPRRKEKKGIRDIKHPSNNFPPPPEQPKKDECQKEEEPLPDLSDQLYLKKLREKKGISLQEISNVTKISVGSLTALENGEYEKFPGRVYIVGFLRSYSEYIGIDVQQAKAHFEILYTNKSKK